LFDWLQEHKVLLWSLTVLSIAMFVGTLIALPLLIARLPADYFTRRPVRDRSSRHPAVRMLLVVTKNLLGLVLLLSGLAMLLLPGQGLLMILVAIILLDFPRKRELERWLIRRRPIFRAVNWIRARRRRPPLERPGQQREQRG
jgi:hypothetical protein